VGSWAAPRSARLGPGRHLSMLVLAGVTVLVGSVPAVPAASPHSHVAFPATDGVTLRGRFWARGKTVVVLAHMLGTDQSSWGDLAGHLAARGYTVLTFDFRGVGESSGRFVIGHLARDTLGAVRFVRRRDPTKIVLIGASMGGTAALMAAGETPVDGVVAIASGMT